MYWWAAPREKDLRKSKLHDLVWPHVKDIEERQIAIHRLNLRNAKLYSNRELMSLDWNSQGLREVNHGPVSNTMENLLASAVDSITALIGRQQPKVTPVVDDADFVVEREGRKLDQYLYAEFKCQDVYAKMQRAFNDCLWAQIGCLRVDIDGDDIYTERVMPDEIIVDQRECVSDCEPLQIHHRRVVNKHALMHMFPEFKDKIDELKNNWVSFRRPDETSCVLVESWYLGQNGEPGRHVVTVQNATLVDEPYTRKRFPFIFLRWITLPTGFYGRSLVEYGTPYQLRQNELNRVIQLAQDLMCVPRIIVPGGMSVIKTTVDNEIARFIHTRGGEPKVVTWQAVAEDLYNERERNRRTFFEDIGLSTLFAQATPPPGVRFDSSKALREFNFRENERFQRQAQMLENAYIELAEHYIELNTILRKNGTKRKLKWYEYSVADQIEWPKFAEDRTKYVLRLEASSVINMTPAAREEQLNEWVARGWISVEKAKSLSNHPDLAEEESLWSASLDDIKWIASQLDQEIIPEVDNLSNLVEGAEFLHKTYLKRKRQKNVPEGVLEAYRHYLIEIKFALEQQKAQETALQQQLLAAAQPTRGPEGNILPAEATTAKGVPVRQF